MQSRAPIHVGRDAAHEVMSSRSDRYAFSRDVETIVQTRVVDMAEFLLKNSRWDVRDIEEDVRLRPGGQLTEDRSADFIPRQEFIDEALAALVNDVSAFAPQRLRQKESRGP